MLGDSSSRKIEPPVSVLNCSCSIGLFFHDILRMSNITMRFC
jgi:hypothetical protein